MQNYKCQGINKNNNNCGCKEYYGGRFINGLMCACGDNCYKHCPVCNYGGDNSCDDTDNTYNDDDFVEKDDCSWNKSYDYVPTDEELDDDVMEEFDEFEDDDDLVRIEKFDGVNKIDGQNEGQIEEQLGKQDKEYIKEEIYSKDIFKFKLKCFTNDKSSCSVVKTKQTVISHRETIVEQTRKRGSDYCSNKKSKRTKK